ncbi:MAG: cardiolipin synthase B [Rhodocyclaceae bacterium]|nr:cardiolipin synthase B [Rhodocyclaceae bacterium]
MPTSPNSAQSDPQRDDLPYRAAAARHPSGAYAAASLLCLALAGCGSLPNRADLPPPPSGPTSKADLAQKMEVHGPAGRLSADQRKALIARLQAEGRQSAMNRQLAVMTEVDKVELYTGNEAQLLIDGPHSFAAMFEALEGARKAIYVESFIVEDESVARRFANLLMRKQAAGVPVFLLYDAYGSIATPASYFDQLRAAGLNVCAYNPVNPLARPGYWGITQRDHRKIVAVDGRQAFTGGINISRVYASGSFSRGKQRDQSELTRDGWRDTQVSLRGPAAQALEAVVRAGWIKQGCKGELPAPGDTRPAPAGDKVVRIIASSPDGESSQIYRALLSAIDTAQHSVHLTMAYFAPGRDLIDALSEAARRGVDVTLILPSVSDFSPTLDAGRSYYEDLMEAGVKIHELQNAFLHAKTAVIDGVWSTIGSSNLDWRSMVVNNEVNAVILGADFARDMEAMFQRDLAQSQRISVSAWAERSMLQKLKEWFARLGERLL